MKRKKCLTRDFITINEHIGRMDNVVSLSECVVFNAFNYNVYLFDSLIMHRDIQTLTNYMCVHILATCTRELQVDMNIHHI